MGIKGDIRSMPLANVLQDLAMNEQTGTLRVHFKDRQIHLWFDRGALRLVGLGPGRGPSLLNGLLALARIAPEQVPEFKGRRTEHSFIRALRKQGMVTSDDLRQALEHQMAELLCDTFLWPEAAFEFQEGDPDDAAFDADQLDLEPRLAVDATIMEALRRADEWKETRKSILTAEEILVPDPARVPPDAEPTTLRVLSLLDGERSLREIRDHSRLGQFVVHRAAALLIRAGAARSLAPDDALQRARNRVARKEWEAALRVLRYALAHERSNPELLELALACAEAVEDHAGAASYARQLAAVRVEAGDLEPAIDAYRKVLAHAPRDLTAYDRLFALMLELDLKLDALAEGERLASAYKKLGLSDKALDVYKRLQAKLGDRPDLLESLAEMQRHLGDKRQAVAIYRKLLARSMEAKDDEAALDYCRVILRIDPHHPETRKLKEQLESGALDRRRKRSRTVKAFVILAAILVVTGVVLTYEWKARSAHEGIQKRIWAAERDRQYRDALDLYDSVLDAYGWSFVARELRPERDLTEANFVKDLLERTNDLYENGWLTEAVASLEQALDVTQLEENRERVQGALDRFKLRLKSEEARWKKELAKAPAEKVGGVREPLAVPALAAILGSPESGLDRRKAAAGALAAIGGDPAAEALKRVLDDRALGQTARDHLARLGRPPLQLSLSREVPADAKGPSGVVEWRITNQSPGIVSFTLNEPLGHRLVVTPKGTPPVGPPTPATMVRSVRLGPGEHLGGSFDLSHKLAEPGSYEIHWTVAITWGERPATLEAAPLAVEIQKK